MRIISSYHDYYDTAMGQGIDPSLVYRRESTFAVLPETEWNPGDAAKAIFDSYDERWMWHDRPEPALLLFCGRIYAYWCGKPSSSATEFGPAYTATALSNLARALWARQDVLDRKGYNPATGDPVFPRLRSLFEFLAVPHDYWGSPVDEKAIHKFSQEVDGREAGPEPFHSLKTPVLLVVRIDNAHRGGPRCHAVQRNPVLKDLDFQKVMDPFTAFQEIAMFLGGVMAAEDQAPIRVGSDEVVARQKGFDEWSFRTQEPGQKKLNRKANKQRKRGGTAEG